MRQPDETEGRARRAAVQRLESLQRAGVMQLGKPPRKASEAANTCAAGAPDEKSPTSPRPQDSLFDADSGSDSNRTWGSELPVEERKLQLDVVRREVASCTRCAELADSRTQTVFGVGNPQARLCFLGEAPGADEDRQGEPFVGRAGKLLTEIIQNGMGLKREDVYILNILKCRPPGNRNPATDEAENCRAYLDRQLEIIQPEFICCLGGVATTNLLATNESIGRLRGHWHSYRGAKVVATYHPAYLLRNPSAKKQTWEDIQMLMREMGLKSPPRRG